MGTRQPDGRAQSENTGYQSNFRSGSHQALTFGWFMPMHQPESLFHKSKAEMGVGFGFEADNHAVNTVPKGTRVRITRAEKHGMAGIGKREIATTGYTPSAENECMMKYLQGELFEV